MGNSQSPSATIDGKTSAYSHRGWSEYICRPSAVYVEFPREVRAVTDFMRKRISMIESGNLAPTVRRLRIAIATSTRFQVLARELDPDLYEWSATCLWKRSAPSQILHLVTETQY